MTHHSCPLLVQIRALEGSSIFIFGAEATNDISPGPRATVAAWDLPDGAAEPLPSCLLDALRALEADTALVDALGPDLVAAYLKLRTQQWESYCGHLSQWELDTGLNA